MELPSLIWSKVLKFSDDQRCQRLQACQDITKCVQNCLQRQREALSLNDGNAKSDMVRTEVLDIESCVSGIRMMKYFHWRESEAYGNEKAPPTPSTKEDGELTNTMDNSMNNENTTTTPIGVPTCAREVHAQWACRAVALACSPHVIQLRDCFEEIGDKDEILSVPYFGYTDTSTTITADPGTMKRIPCREIQANLGKCVAERAAELEQRVSQRKRQEAERVVQNEGSSE